MIIFNASFMIERDREDEFLGWLTPVIDSLNVSAPRISAMREAGGVDYRQAEAQTVAFQCEFIDRNHATDWSTSVFASLAARFEEKFGPQAMVFTSLFEVIDF